MGSVPTTVNKAADFTTRITAVLFKMLEKVLEGLSETYAPFLAAPFVKQCFEFIINWLGEKLSIAIQEDELCLVITFQTTTEKNGYVNAMARLKALPVGGDQNAINDALQKAKDAMDNLGHFDGWAGTH